MKYEEIAKLFHETYNRMALRYGFNDLGMLWENTSDYHKSFMTAIFEDMKLDEEALIECKKWQLKEWN